MPVISLFGNLRKTANAPQAHANGATVREAIEALCAQNAALRDAILDGDRLQPHVRVMVNGRAVELGLGLETPVEMGDQIAIFPPVAGGVLESG